MTVSIDDLWRVLIDVEIRALHVIAQPRCTEARRHLKEACRRAHALRETDAAARHTMDALVQDLRPEPPLSEVAHEGAPVSKPVARTPYWVD